MSPGQCPCPACGTTLRVRDRSFVGRQIECPDCHAKLVLKLNDDREFEAELFKPEVERPASRASAPRHKPQPKTSGNTRSFADTLLSPLVVAWALGIGLTAFVAIMLLRPAVRFRPPSTETAQPIAETVPDIEAAKPPEKIAPDSATQSPDPMPPSIVEKPPVPEVPPTPAEVKPPVPADTEKPATVVTTPEETPKPAVPTPPKVNLEEVLKQRLSGFVTSSKKPNRRLDLIEQLDELTGYRIKFDRQELGEKKLMQTVSISVEVTTVGALLKLVLEPAGWEYVIEDEYLRLKPRQVAGTGTP
ncbi:MAG: hypothetical protein WCJ09_10130 [Planctomycetota bacterium]